MSNETEPTDDGHEHAVRGRARRVDLTSGPLLQRLIGFAWPLFIGNILTTFYNLAYGADGYWTVFFYTNITFFLIAVIWFRRGTWKEERLVR